MPSLDWKHLYSYGLKGKEIMFWSLLALLELTREQTVWTIPAWEFTNHVLIPEATVLFIQEDLNVTREHAIEIKIASSSYGMAAHRTNNELDFCQLQATVRILRVIVKAEDSSLDVGERVNDKHGDD